MFGPPVPAPLTMREAATVAQSLVGQDAELEWIDDLDDGQLFGVTTRFDPQGRPFRESRLLFVYDDGSVAMWPER